MSTIGSISYKPVLTDTFINSRSVINAGNLYDYLDTSLGVEFMAALRIDKTSYSYKLWQMLANKEPLGGNITELIRLFNKFHIKFFHRDLSVKHLNLVLDTSVGVSFLGQLKLVYHGLWEKFSQTATGGKLNDVTHEGIRGGLSPNEITDFGEHFAEFFSTGKITPPRSAKPKKPTKPSQGKTAPTQQKLKDKKRVMYPNAPSKQTAPVKSPPPQAPPDPRSVITPENVSEYLETPIGVEFLEFLETYNPKLRGLLMGGEQFKKAENLVEGQKIYLVSEFNKFHKSQFKIDIKTEAGIRHLNLALNSGIGYRFLNELKRKYPDIHAKFVRNKNINDLDETKGEQSKFANLFTTYFKTGKIPSPSPAEIKEREKKKAGVYASPSAAGAAAPQGAVSYQKKPSYPALLDEFLREFAKECINGSEADKAAFYNVIEELKNNSEKRFSYDEMFLKKGIESELKALGPGWYVVPNESLPPDIAEQMKDYIIFKNPNVEYGVEYVKRTDLIMRALRKVNNTNLGPLIMELGESSAVLGEVLATVFENIESVAAFKRANQTIMNKYGPDADIVKQTLKSVSRHAVGADHEPKIKKPVPSSEAQKKEWEFKQKVFEIIAHRILNEKVDINSVYIKITPDLWLDMRFVKGERTLENIKKSLRDYKEKLKFKAMPKGTIIDVDPANASGFIYKHINNAKINIDASKTTAERVSEETARQADEAGGAGAVFGDAIAGAAYGLLVEFPYTTAEALVNPPAMLLFVASLTTEEGLDALKDDFLQTMQSGDTFGIAAYVSLNAAMVAGILGGAIHGIKGAKSVKLGMKKLSGAPETYSLIIDGHKIINLSKEQVVSILRQMQKSGKDFVSKVEISLLEADGTPKSTPKKTVSTTREKLAKAVKEIRKFIGDTVQKAKDIARKAKDMARKAKEIIQKAEIYAREAAKNAPAKIQAKIREIAGQIEEMAQKSEEMAQRAQEYANEALKQTGEKAKELAQKAKDMAQESEKYAKAAWERLNDMARYCADMLGLTPEFVDVYGGRHRIPRTTPEPAKASTMRQGGSTATASGKAPLTVEELRVKINSKLPSSEQAIFKNISHETIKQFKNKLFNDIQAGLEIITEERARYLLREMQIFESFKEFDALQKILFDKLPSSETLKINELFSKLDDIAASCKMEELSRIREHIKRFKEDLLNSKTNGTEVMNKLEEIVQPYEINLKAMGPFDKPLKPLFESFKDYLLNTLKIDFLSERMLNEIWAGIEGYLKTTGESKPEFVKELKIKLTRIFRDPDVAKILTDKSGKYSGSYKQRILLDLIMHNGVEIAKLEILNKAVRNINIFLKSKNIVFKIPSHSHLIDSLKNMDMAEVQILADNLEKTFKRADLDTVLDNDYFVDGWKEVEQNNKAYEIKSTRREPVGGTFVQTESGPVEVPELFTFRKGSMRPAGDSRCIITANKSGGVTEINLWEYFPDSEKAHGSLKGKKEGPNAGKEERVTQSDVKSYAYKCKKGNNVRSESSPAAKTALFNTLQKAALKERISKKLTYYFDKICPDKIKDIETICDSFIKRMSDPYKGLDGKNLEALDSAAIDLHLSLKKYIPEGYKVEFFQFEDTFDIKITKNGAAPS